MRNSNGRDAEAATDGKQPDADSRTIEIRERMALAERRVRQKIGDYESYHFSLKQIRALNVFFDLCQELQGREFFYDVCVTVPKVFFSLESRMYILEDEETFVLVGKSSEEDEAEVVRPRGKDTPSRRRLQNGLFYVPIKSNPRFNDMLPFDPPGNVIGCFEFFPVSGVSERLLLFLEKYVNRIGYQLHSRIIRAKNREHIRFINNLVKDIGHNVIVPNVYFRLFYNRLRGKIEGLKGLSDSMRLDEDSGRPDPLYVERRKTLDYLHGGITEQLDEIFRHYEQTSLFLETLLRRQHFVEGRYVLDKRICDLKRQIIEPQVERFMSRFADRGIRVQPLKGSDGNVCINLKADVGLISQVYANLFSNAVKYAREVELPEGGKGNRVYYGWSIIDNYYGPGLSGVKMNVQTTGAPLPENERKGLFSEGFRAGNVESEYGTGHGLYFVRQVVELHDGVVGYEPKSDGNNFYFILPLETIS